MDVLIDKLNVAGYLLKKGHRQYQVTSILRTSLLLHLFLIHMSRNCAYWDIGTAMQPSFFDSDLNMLKVYSVIVFY